jgi:hypothetical protein
MIRISIAILQLIVIRIAVVVDILKQDCVIHFVRKLEAIVQFLMNTVYNFVRNWIKHNRCLHQMKWRER